MPCSKDFPLRTIKTLWNHLLQHIKVYKSYILLCSHGFHSFKTHWNSWNKSWVHYKLFLIYYGFISAAFLFSAVTRYLDLFPCNVYHHGYRSGRTMYKEVLTMSNYALFWKGFKRGMHKFGENLTIIVNSSLLFVVYILGAGLTSLCAKIFRKKFLETKLSLRDSSYWSDLHLQKKSLNEYYRQFWGRKCTF